MLEIKSQDSDGEFFESSFMACRDGSPNPEEKEWAFTSNKVIAECVLFETVSEESFSKKKFKLVQFTDFIDCKCGSVKRSELVMFPTSTETETHVGTSAKKTYRSNIGGEPGRLFILQIAIEKVGELKTTEFNNVYALAPKD